jgi:aminomethyltransferase
MLKTTKLFFEHQKLNAQMVPFAGFSMPIQYTSIKEECLAVRNRVGVFDVSHMGEFFIEGIDTSAFIDFIISNDFSSAPIGKAIYSPLCNEIGGIVDDLIAYKIHSQKALLCVNASNIQKDWDHIQKYIKNFNCKIYDQSNEYSLLAIQGPDTMKILDCLELINLPRSLDTFSICEINWHGSQLIVARTGYTGEDGVEIFIPDDKVFLLWEKLMHLKVTPCGLGARDVLRIEACYPLYGQELNEELTPFECALKWTVGPNKGLFVGKESILNREQKYQLIKLSLDKGVPRNGHTIENEDCTQIGVVTSGTMSPFIHRGIAMARIEKSKVESTKVYIRIREKRFEAKIHKRSFIKGEK